MAMNESPKSKMVKVVFHKPIRCGKKLYQKSLLPQLVAEEYLEGVMMKSLMKKGIVVVVTEKEEKASAPSTPAVDPKAAVAPAGAKSGK